MLPHGHKCIGNSDLLPGQLSDRSNFGQNGVLGRLLTADDGGVAPLWRRRLPSCSPALSRPAGRDPIIAEAAVANDSQKPRGNQLAQVAARRRARGQLAQ